MSVSAVVSAVVSPLGVLDLIQECILQNPFTPNNGYLGPDSGVYISFLIEQLFPFDFAPGADYSIKGWSGHKELIE